MARAWCLKQRPNGEPVMADFSLETLPDQPLADGEIRVRNRWLSVDPYMRGRMQDGPSYIPAFALGEPMSGGAVGTVIESRNTGFAAGDTVLHMGGWRDEAVVGPALSPVKLPETGLPAQAWLHVMGLTGATAWMGLVKVAQVQAGDLLFVSAAAGAVGSMVVQIAKAKGLTVIGSAGGADKCRWVESLGADATIDYRAGPVLDQLRAVTARLERKVDVYFDNVGGEHLDAALAQAAEHARFAICGMIGNYNARAELSLRFARQIIVRRVRIEGFLYADFMADMPVFHADMQAMLAAGQVVSRETVRDGLESTPDAFLGLFSGANMGKMLVRL